MCLWVGVRSSVCPFCFWCLIVHFLHRDVWILPKVHSVEVNPGARFGTEVLLRHTVENNHCWVSNLQILPPPPPFFFSCSLKKWRTKPSTKTAMPFFFMLKLKETRVERTMILRFILNDKMCTWLAQECNVAKWIKTSMCHIHDVFRKGGIKLNCSPILPETARVKIFSSAKTHKRSLICAFLELEFNPPKHTVSFIHFFFLHIFQQTAFVLLGLDFQHLGPSAVRSLDKCGFDFRVFILLLVRPCAFFFQCNVTVIEKEGNPSVQSEIANGEFHVARRPTYGI